MNSISDPPLPKQKYFSHDRSSVLFPVTEAELEVKAVRVDPEVSEMVPCLVLISFYATGIEYSRILFAANCPRNMPPQKALANS